MKEDEKMIFTKTFKKIGKCHFIARTGRKCPEYVEGTRLYCNSHIKYLKRREKQQLKDKLFKEYETKQTKQPGITTKFKDLSLDDVL